MNEVKIGMMIHSFIWNLWKFVIDNYFWHFLDCRHQSCQYFSELSKWIQIRTHTQVKTIFIKFCPYYFLRYETWKRIIFSIKWIQNYKTYNCMFCVVQLIYYVKSIILLHFEIFIFLEHVGCKRLESNFPFHSIWCYKS